jgi:hypothetical protein
MGWRPVDVRYWHLVDIPGLAINVRFRGKSRHRDRWRAEVANGHERPDVMQVVAISSKEKFKSGMVSRRIKLKKDIDDWYNTPTW